MTVLVRAEDIVKSYEVSNQISRNKTTFKALDNVTIEIEKGQSIGLIGESGCGKSTLGKILVGLEKSNTGKVIVNQVDITNLKLKEMKPIRKNAQMIFQNTTSTFNPRSTIGQSIEEVIKNFEKTSKEDRVNIVKDILKKVGLDESFYNRYPNELSGGQCQRANIARAIVLKPKFVVCDEPVSSLDFSIRKNILNLLRQLSEDFGVTYLFITHDLSTIKYVCKKIAVMYLGKIVEILDIDKIEEKMSHPYTKILFDAVLVADPTKRGKRREVMGEISQNVDLISGCNFQRRCNKCMEICKEKVPKLKEIEKGHSIACHMFK
ncbi:ABC transporter ATP-binding protein [Romboutsia maritimum]|uniref:ABC transporter ATP-binding protein n=1 Tax=Romboutsia maritimum TaxID=2020948 RepID=A0A371IVV5_9FIRM|nr:ABC transporter ATP-binding protein [Romboutsia maritimum]RDY24610.1 ABC transporter ATP-binding protein [Romboutsia maritimum]